MKPVLSVLLVLFLVIVVVHRSSSYDSRIDKRYYDVWEPDNNGGNDGESIKGSPNRQKGFNKEDPCENKPLWFLKSQVRLGKLSPFYDCLVDHGMERK
ncbi:unnamed protein product [Rotaria sordida]|uniref:Uncharacterized protein n=1 Tax=Rotaria sordida TaxID=392033 RepID=A0A819I2D1_9BILA|nr:unnamed protein product [Rotaria sordida]CAF0991250.1 unnamed protein product [Rotaria sordida]CAF1128967.1 unnamed protein product [Rotaria sordida]CAF1129022.1 unnamed protein product [Rotaria sordida]CAF1203617.1 unnamed protein product [Rotaria sordida]